MGCSCSKRSATRVDASVHPESDPDPMWILKVTSFMQMTGAPRCFEVLHHQKLLTEWFPEAFVIFVSHEWLGRDHPDITGNQTHCLRMALFNIMNASVKVCFDCLSQSLGCKDQLSAAHADKFKNGYMWIDWMCLPQNHLENNLDSRMPLFVQRCAIFAILAPKLKTSSGTMSSYASYGKRGWCRAEIWFKQMSIKPKDVPIIQITDTESVKFLRPVSWVYETVHEGAFTVASDCERLNTVMESLMSQKLSEFLVNDLNHYRYFTSRFEAIVGHPRRKRTLQEFLRDFKFTEKSLRSSSGLGPVACAVLSGDVALLPTLVEKRASLSRGAPTMVDVDIIPGITPLALAAKQSCDPEIIIELVKLRANVNETDSLGTCVLGHAGSPEVVQVLLDLQADVNQRKGPFGLSALSACILRPLQPEGLKLMLEAKAFVNVGAGMYSLSPLSTATLFREMPRNVEICHLLLDAQADVNYREGFYVFLNRLARALCCLQRHPSILLNGIVANQGSTPLFVAAWFGNPEMVNLLLEAKADPEIRNDRGTSYVEALNFAHSNCETTSMTWQIQGPSRWAVHAKDTVESVPETKDAWTGAQSPVKLGRSL